MTTQTSDRGLKWRVTGQAMIDRFTRHGIRVAADRSEMIPAVWLLWWGITLQPGFAFQPIPPALGALTYWASAQTWGVMAILLSVPQIGGMLAAWMGYYQPIRTPRMFFLFSSGLWWTAVAASLAFAGFAIAPVVYAGAALMAFMNYHKVNQSTYRVR